MVTRKHWKTIALLIVGVFFLAGEARSHCDTMNGPVVKDARLALRKGDVTPVLKWLKKEYEAEVTALFEKTLRVRGSGTEARELADMHFFETVVRLHRAGEGEPYTGLKAEETPVEVGIEAADRALDSGNVEEVVKKVTADVEARIRSGFARVQETKRDAAKSVDAGRAYVEAYVAFIHFVEEMHQVARAEGSYETDAHNARRIDHHN